MILRRVWEAAPYNGFMNRGGARNDEGVLGMTGKILRRVWEAAPYNGFMNRGGARNDEGGRSE